MRENSAQKENPTVLVADDSPMMLTLIRAMLKKAEFTVEGAEDGEAARAAFVRCKPDLILLDVIMPKMDGFEACAAIRQCPSRRKNPYARRTQTLNLQQTECTYDERS
jgi:CheY-like chemotaxis protein